MYAMQFGLNTFFGSGTLTYTFLLLNHFWLSRGMRDFNFFFFLNLNPPFTVSWQQWWHAFYIARCWVIAFGIFGRIQNVLIYDGIVYTLFMLGMSNKSMVTQEYNFVSYVEFYLQDIIYFPYWAIFASLFIISMGSHIFSLSFRLWFHSVLFCSWMFFNQLVSAV